MSLVRWNRNQNEFDELMTRAARMLGGFSSPLLPTSLLGREGLGRESMTFADWSPAVDIHETGESFIVDVELPQVKREDVKVTVHDGVLSIAGERKQEKEEKNKKLHRVERSFGRFERSFALPGTIDEQKITARFADGMLHVLVPKAAAGSVGAREVKIG